MSAYTLASLIKIGIGIVVLLTDYFLINVHEDPAIGIALALIGFFIFSRGSSYFIFYLAQDLFRGSDTRTRIQKDAYKTSFIFGLYILINILLFIAEIWNKIFGIILLIIFLSMSYFIFFTPQKSHDSEFHQR